MSKTDFEKWESEIRAFPAEKTTSPGMPVETFLQENENRHHWMQSDKAVLVAIGLDWENTVDLLPERLGACRHVQSVWMTELRTQKESMALWKTKSEEGYFLRDDLIDIMQFAFRANDELLMSVSLIAEGTGHDDMIQDLNDLAVLGRKNVALLTAIGIDPAKLDSAEALADELAVLLARANGDREGSSETKILRDKAFGYAKELSDTICEYGKFAFRHNEARRKGYTSAYSHKKYLKRAAAKRTEAGLEE